MPTEFFYLFHAARLRNGLDFYRISLFVCFGLLQPSFLPVCNFVFSHIDRLLKGRQTENKLKIN